MRVPEREIKISLVGMLAKAGRVADAIVIVEQLLKKRARAGRFEDDYLRSQINSARLCWRGIEARRAINLDLRIPEAHLNLALDIVPNLTYGGSACGMQRRNCGG